MRFAKRQMRHLKRQRVISTSQSMISFIDVVLFLHIILAYLMVVEKVYVFPSHALFPSLTLGWP